MERPGATHQQPESLYFYLSPPSSCPLFAEPGIVQCKNTPSRLIRFDKRQHALHIPHKCKICSFFHFRYQAQNCSSIFAAQTASLPPLSAPISTKLFNRFSLAPNSSSLQTALPTQDASFSPLSFEYAQCSIVVVQARKNTSTCKP